MRAVVAALALVFLEACDPIFGLTVHVEDSAGTPLPDAALSLTDCPGQNEQNVAGVASLSDASGVASVGGLGFAYPPCNWTVAKPGFQPFESSFLELCHGDLDDCERVQEIDVVLDAN